MQHTESTAASRPDPSLSLTKSTTARIRVAEPSEGQIVLWAVSKLEQCLATGFGLVDVQAILVRLGSLAESRPLQVTGCVEVLVQDEQQLRYPFMWEREFASILKILLANPDHAVHHRVRRVVDKLVEGGSLFARDLVAVKTGEQ